MFNHAIIIMMENRPINGDFGIINRPGGPYPVYAPYITSLANNYSLAEAYYDLSNGGCGSITNYIGITMGDVSALDAACNSGHHCNDNLFGACTMTGQNIADRIEAAGLTWMAYMEDMDTPCELRTSNDTLYQTGHNPWIYYADIRNSTTSPRCQNHVVPAGNTGRTSNILTHDTAFLNDLNSPNPPNYMWLTPNICNDMYDYCTSNEQPCPTNSLCSCTRTDSNLQATCVGEGDTYLKALVPQIMSTQAWKANDTALFITWDEPTFDNSSQCPNWVANPPWPSDHCQIPGIWVGPMVKQHYRSSVVYQHYSFLKALEAVWNLPPLTTNDASARLMSEFFTAPSTAYQTFPKVVPSYVITIVLENQNLPNVYGSGCGSSCAYITQLADTYGLAMNYSGVGHNSLVNYLTLTSGKNYSSYNGSCLGSPNVFGCDCSPSTCHVNGTGTNLMDIIEQSGRTWKAYMEDYVGGCQYSQLTGGRIDPLGNTTEYASSHNPFVYYQDIAGWNSQTQNVTRCANIVNANPQGTGYLSMPTALLSDLNGPSPPKLMWLTPNGCNDGHDYNSTNCPVTNPVLEQNNYLQKLVPMILNSTTFRTQPSALFITWDEGRSCPGTGQTFPACTDPVATIWAGPAVGQSIRSNIVYSHYSFVTTLESIWRLTPLPLPPSISPSPMLDFFTAQGFAASAISPAPTIVGTSQNSTTIVTKLNQTNYVVSLTDNIPSGLACGSITPSSITGSGTAYLACSSGVAGNYTVKTTATSGSLVRSTNATFQFQDFNITAAPPLYFQWTWSLNSTITVTSLNHFNGNVNLTITKPANLTCGIAPSNITGFGTAILSCTTLVSGNYSVIITGRSGSVYRNASISMNFTSSETVGGRIVAIDKIGLILLYIPVIEAVLIALTTTMIAKSRLRRPIRRIRCSLQFFTCLSHVTPAIC